MAIAKVILNNEVLMDVTSNTNITTNMLNGVVGTKNDGTSVTGNIATKSAANLYTSTTSDWINVVTPAGYYSTNASFGFPLRSELTQGGANIVAQAGYYSEDIVYTVNTGSAFPPAVTITKNPTFSMNSSTGVVTASYTGSSSITPTVNAGYISQGTAGTVSTTGTSTFALTSKAAGTYYPSTVDQTISSYRWLTGTQTIKSVTTTNLTAANIAEGVVVKVGDANNASRITQITGTHSGATSYTATISGTGNSSYCYVTHSGTKYYTNGNTFTFKAGDTLTIYCRGNSLTVNGDTVSLSSYSYTYTLPVGDITINLSYSSSTSNNIKVWGLVQPTGTLTISAAGTHNTYKYSAATVAAGSAFPPAVTITTNPTIGVNTYGVVTATYTGSSSITPTVNAGYVSQGTAGTISTTGTSTYQLTSQAAAVYHPSTADQTIASQRWLAGSQTIKSVVTSNLTAANIAEGVVVKIGDATNDSRITQITGTHAGGTKYTATFETTIARTRIYYNGSTYYGGTPGSFDFSFGDTCGIECYGSLAGGTIYENGISIGTCDVNAPYTYTMPSNNFTLSTTGTATGRVDITFPTISITENGIYNVRDYTLADVAVQPVATYTVNEIAKRTISGSISGDATTIGLYAFAGCSSLTAASFPACTTISTQAFTSCYKLTTISFPVCTSIGSSAFSACSSLTTASFPACTTISAYAFYACYRLTTASFPVCTLVSSNAFNACYSLATISFPECKSIIAYAFTSCSSLTTASFPKCTSIGYSAFFGCSSLTTASFPACTTISTCAFARCYKLTTISFPVCTIISTYAFSACYSLTTASFPACTSIASYAFQSCYNLLSLYLLGSSVVSLSANAFSSTPISNYTTSTGGVYGSIFVPSSLYNTYITATNWTVYSSRIVSM